MKILVPDHYSDTDMREMRAVSSELETVKLNIVWNKGVLPRIAGKLWNRLLPYHERRRNPNKSSHRPKNISIDGRSLDQEGKDVNIFLSSWVITPDILNSLLPFLPNLKWIHTTLTGVDRLLSSEPIRKDIILTSTVGVHGKRIAEFVLALMLMVAKKMPDHLKLQRLGRWQSIQAEELRGRTVGIIGYGHIGREVARRALAFEMKVLAITRDLLGSENEVAFLHEGDLRGLLKASDFLVICAPLTRETEHLIGEAELSVMKKEAYLINVSRGEIVHEKALIRALQENRIAGACLDVFTIEPLPYKSPFYSLPNVVITHHSSYSSPATQREVFNFFLANLKRFAAGETLLGIVDREKGY